jgi:Fe-S cluster assembly protein SufB/Fe-S cluster assembly protein SufD
MTQILLSAIRIEDLINSNEPLWLQNLRENAFKCYNLLPHEVSTLYNKYTVTPTLDTNAISIDIDHDKSTNLSNKFNENNINIINLSDKIYRINISNQLIEKGVIIKSIIDAIREHEELLKHIINKIDLNEDKFLALEQALFNSGIFIYIPKNLELNEPIRIIHEQNTNGSSSVLRNIFYLEESSSATIIHELYSNYHGKELKQVLFELNELYLANNARLNHIILQTMSNCAHIANTKAYLYKDAKLNSYLGSFGGSLSRYKIDNILNDEGANVEHTETIFGSNDQRFDITTNLLHNSPNTKGKVIAKNIVRDKAIALFKGMIKIGKSASNSESYLAGHAIILNKGAKADAIPSLEIENKEVKATHSASVAQLDEEQLFYLTARGFNINEAKKMIILGFIDPLLRQLEPELRAWIKHIVDNKWNGKSLAITDSILNELIEIEREYKNIERDLFEKHYKYR